MKSLPVRIESLEKYLRGTCNPEEKKEVEDWYRDLDKDADRHIPQLTVPETMKLFKKIKQHIKGFEDDVDFRPARVISLSGRTKALIAVAAVFIFICGTYFITKTQFSPARPSFADKADHTVFNNRTAAVVERRLPDGSAVWLTPGSTLTYERKTAQSIRDVTFNGEAFFDVAKDSLHPFIIHANEMDIRVVGTSFNVIALPTSRTFKVSVVTGKVQVTGQGKTGKVESVYLTPNHQASFNLSSKKIVQTVLSEAQIKKQYWRPFSLNFSDATMDVVSKELQNAFQVKVEFSDASIANCHLKVDFNNLQLPQIITFLEKLLDVKCELIDGSTLKITGEGCSK